tara:strand:+ start:1321 stop:1503 length:183 start_codon:yes stop_codon:yes gene_type:complete
MSKEQHMLNALVSQREMFANQCAELSAECQVAKEQIEGLVAKVAELEAAVPVLQAANPKP